MDMTSLGGEDTKAGAAIDTKEGLVDGRFGPLGLPTSLFALLIINALDLLSMRDASLGLKALAAPLSAVLQGLTVGPAAKLFERDAESDRT
jgi:hypothetical protein